MATQNYNQARSTIIGVGGFGLYAVAHLAPRLRFINAQRRMVNPGLPDLDRLVSYGLLIPRRPDPNQAPDSPAGAGSIELWIPRSQNIQEIGPFEIQDFRREAEQFARELHALGRPEPPAHPSPARRRLDEAYYTWRAAHGVTGEDVFMAEIVSEALIRFLEEYFRPAGRCTLIGGSGGRVGRRDVLRSLEIEANTFGMQLEHQLSAAYHDLHQPMEQETHITTYIIASACDDWAGALLWPLGHLLRRRLSDYPVETVGLISTGPYSPPPYRAYEEASAYAALLELDYLSRRSARKDGRPGGHSLRDTPYESWQLLRESAGAPAFDRCYLLDAVKASRATASGEHEVAVSIANALELFIVGNGDQIVQEQLAAGLSLEHRTTYSALGASVKFLPIQKIQYWVRRRLAAEIIDERMLGIDGGQVTALQEEGDRYAVEQGLTLEGMARAVTAGVPVTLRAPGRGSVLPTFSLRDEAALLPPELLPVPGGRGRRHRLPPVEWYRLMSHHREELLRNELIRPLMQQSNADPLATAVSRQLGIWRLNMHLTGGTTETIELNTAIAEHSPGIYTAQHNNLDVVLTAATVQTATGAQITTARVIPYTERSYLGLPITEVRRATDDTYRELMGLEEGGENDRSVVGRLQSDLIRRTSARITGDNKGLQNAQAWLRGILTRIHDELDRLPHDDRAEQSFQQDWNRRLIALEQTLGGRPSPDGAAETRGLAQRRPETAALIARALVAAGFLLFSGFTFLRRVLPVTLSGWQTAGVGVALVLIPFVLVGLFRLVYDLQAARFRRRTLALFQEQIDRQITLSTIDAATAALRRTYGAVANLLGALDRDIRTAEAWRDENLGEREFRIEDQSDTILRQAIGDPELVSAVGQANRHERDEELAKIGNLWQWHERPAHESVMEALRIYAAHDPTPPPPPTGRGRRRAGATPQAAVPPPTLIWQWLEGTVNNVAGRFVDRQNRYTQNIETYIARHPRSVMVPGTDTADPALLQGVDEAHDFLIDMGYLAKPYIFLEEVELVEPVIAVDLLGVDRQDGTRFNRTFLSELRSDPRWSTHPPRLVSTFDPFSITYLRTLHGLPARSLSRWARYRDAFAGLGRRDRGLLELLPTAVYEVGEAKSAAELFFAPADDDLNTPPEGAMPL